MELSRTSISASAYAFKKSLAIPEIMLEQLQKTLTQQNHPQGKVNTSLQAEALTHPAGKVTRIDIIV